MQTDWLEPPDDLRLTSHQVDIWRVSLDKLPDSVQWAESTLSADEVQRAARFRFEADRRRFLISHASLRDILARHLRQPPQEVQFGVGEHGKPILLSDSQLDFNLSHSGDFALIGVASGRKVGVDVEKFRHDMEQERIARRFFSENENAELKSLPDKQKIDGFFTCWTRKEAYIKAHGLGLSLPLNSFDVSLTPHKPALLLATRPDPHEASRWTLLSLDVHPGYTGAVAVEGRGMEFRHWEWTPIP
jgi:4'-phosphopantetheinyl transferase